MLIPQRMSEAPPATRATENLSVRHWDATDDGAPPPRMTPNFVVKEVVMLVEGPLMAKTSKSRRSYERRRIKRFN